MTDTQCPIVTLENSHFFTDSLDSLDSLESLEISTEKGQLIEKLLAIGTALSSSNNLEELLNLILSKSREITYSDGGSVYLIDRSYNTPRLIFKVAQNDSLPNAPFNEFAMPLTRQSLAGYVALTGETLNLSDAYNLPSEVPYDLDKTFDNSMNYRTCSVLVLPMQEPDGEIIGVLQLINRKINGNVSFTKQSAEDLTQPYSASEERIVRSLASQAAISIQRNQLQESIENLFEEFVRASVQIIETRDPTTSGHSERVAELTVRLGEEASSILSGPLREIYFSDRQLRELRYGALLHDFGKVGVPEAVLGKQKKLYPQQFEAIRHRFAIAQRTKEMECAQAKFRYLLEHPSSAHENNSEGIDCIYCKKIEQTDVQVNQHIQALNYYWDLIRELNEPDAILRRDSQIFSEETAAQLKALAQYTYRDIDGVSKPLITEEEMAQLLIPRGNLTPEERLGIESHVTHTYQFLRRIPWTKHLKNVPTIAYGHHEKLDGSGYPQGLKQEQISIQTQILTVADIYDALTASDRPYKRRLPVETAIHILRQEASKNKINQDLVELFEQRQVFSVLGHTLGIDSHSLA
ncbi:MAG TPA: phosphohydrolase [Cyanobacteria bacterium UBA11149]|nr:phosphohydrolase [Cyanobacteria bacterium UBA11366]HBK64390.1 phosphohydrolase [Cyanobacteria bacterium UBA11166]HBR72724.1 phosphohydrolase [Cyanobacteria bacterium UBA11159]HBW90655.1 phosphohydrolase [Cyanobacteria bacterium UBA11149]HCA96121.1 phosphohydrolase [Cyanobacteria bacterium UBA9226]